MIITYKKKTAKVEWRTNHAYFLAWDWNDICNGTIVIQGKEIVDLASTRTDIMAILFLSLIQVRQLSVSGEGISTG